MGRPSKWLRALMLNNKYLCFVNNNQDHHRHINGSSAGLSDVPKTAKALSGGGDVTYAAEIRSSSDSHGGRQVWAAVKIQSHFRAYLSRRALRALKSLVKLQALVRGQIVRKQTAYNIRRVALLRRVQARALAKRSHISQSLLPFSNGLTSDGTQMSLCSDKYSQSLNTSKELSIHRIVPGMSSFELEYLNVFQHPEDGYYYTTFKPAKSNCSTSCQCSFSKHPNYMSYTESSRAKMRSMTAPKQRSQYERSSSSSTRRREYSNQCSNDFRVDSRKLSELQAKLSNKLSGRRLERLGVINRRR